MKTLIQKLFGLFALFCGTLTFAQPTWTPQICMVTVDEQTASYVSVIWNKPTVADIDSFYIYRKKIIGGGYDLIAKVDYADSSVYDDIAVNVNLRQYTYAISAINQSGIEGAKSPDATTALLDVISYPFSGFNTCQWQNYENTSNPATGFQCAWDPTGGLFPNTAIGGLMSPSLSSWNHFGASASSTYRLEIVVGGGCSPSRGAINTSRSNIKTASDPSSMIETLEQAEKLVRAFPNPASDNIQLEWNAAMGVSKIDLVGARGELMMSYSPEKDELKKSFDLSEINEGIYFVQFHSEKGIVCKRMVVM